MRSRADQECDADPIVELTRLAKYEVAKVPRVKRGRREDARFQFHARLQEIPSLLDEQS